MCSCSWGLSAMLDHCHDALANVIWATPIRIWSKNEDSKEADIILTQRSQTFYHILVNRFLQK